MTKTYMYTAAGPVLDEDAARNYIRDGFLTSPRTVLKGCIKLPQVTLKGIELDQNQISMYAQQALESAIGPVAGAHRGVMFTGGFDSLLICLLAQRCGAKVTAVTVQFEDYNPLTVQGAIKAAQEMEIAHHIINVKAVEFLSAFEFLAGVTDEPLLDLDLALVYAALKKYDHRIAGDVFIAGMGSDQWFGNEALDPKPKDFQTRLDLAFADVAAHQKVAQTHGCKLIFPFLSEQMLALSRSIPADMKKDKNMLRALAVANKIPHRGAKTEIQIPNVMRQIVVKAYGNRAWPSPVSVDSGSKCVDNQILRQIVLGLWLEKALKKIIA